MPASELKALGLGLARKILTRLSEILATEFPTNTPEELGRIIQRIIDFIISVLDSNDDERVLKYVCQYLQELSSHLRYIEGASSARIPTSIITPLEVLIEQMEPGARVMLRVQSSYNYEIFDIIAFYRKMLDELVGTELDVILGSTPHLYIVAVPAVEHSNILLHTLLAHEAGHRIARKYMDSEDQEAVVNNINTLMGTDLRWWDREAETLPPLLKLELRQRIFELIHRARASALKELISDAVAYHLCGVSALFAMDDFCCTDVLDARPEEAYGFYPPWRYRLRQLVSMAYADNFHEAVKLITGPVPLVKIRDAVGERFSRLREITLQTPDCTLIDGDRLLQRAYSDIPEVLEKASEYISHEVAGLRYTHAKLSEEIPALLERLSLGIPPDTRDGEVVDIRSALAAGWFYRTARLPMPNDEDGHWQPKDDEVLNRLVLKAIEAIQLVRDFRAGTT